MPDVPPVVLLATSAALRDLTLDDRIFAAALVRRGVTARAAVWDDPEVDWSARSVVLRSTWDYFRRPTEFLSWAARVAAGALLQNPLPVITWNAHKRYLATLQKGGVPIIDTVFLSHGDTCDLAALAETRSWSDIVIKPAVSAAGHETKRFAADERAAAQSHVDRLLAAGDVMAQPYLAPLAERGELSVIFIGGRFSHGIRRRSAFSNDRSMPKEMREIPSAAAGHPLRGASAHRGTRSDGCASDHAAALRARGPRGARSRRVAAPRAGAHRALAFLQAGARSGRADGGATHSAPLRLQISGVRLAILRVRAPSRYADLISET